MTTTTTAPKSTEHARLHITVLGRTLEHLGVQMYKSRPGAIAELIANSWDAGAKFVDIQIPTDTEYDPDLSAITILDSGCGMSFAEIRDAYLVVGRNRRAANGVESHGRRLMGRKGIGKLAGFGIAEHMTIHTWRDDEGIEFKLNLKSLKAPSGSTGNIEVPWEFKARSSGDPISGTKIVLSGLKHTTPLVIDTLCNSLARRFSRTVQGRMLIRVNGSELPDPTPPLDNRFPDKDLNEEEIGGGHKVKYWYGFAEHVIKTKDLRGFAIHVHGKTAQAPPFFFDVEATASGQHSTKYVVGTIEADFLDDGTDDEGDIISTDRQEIEWDNEEVSGLKIWGQELSRRVLAECRDFKGKKIENWILADSDIQSRIDRLGRPTRQHIERFLKTLGQATDESERTRDLASALVRAYEFHQFHSVLGDLEEVADDPEGLVKLLSQLHDWQALESRAILEVIKGRIQIIDKFGTMLRTDAPETKSKLSPDNMHDLIAGNPWLLNPEWQILAEEKAISTQLREWLAQDIPEDTKRMRYDFLGLSSEGRLVVIEIKRPDYAADIDELNRLETYADRLSIAHENIGIYKVFVCGREPKINKSTLETWKNRSDGEIRSWSNLFEGTKRIYEHYRALLEGAVAHKDFHSAKEEIAATRKLLETGTVHRDAIARDGGIGPQDVDYQEHANTDDE